MRWLDWALRYRVDRTRREVHATVAGAFGARAVFREGLGCLLVHGDGAVPEAEGLEKPQPPLVAAFEQPGVVEPRDPELRKALDQAFAEPDPTRPRRTKAVVVLHDGKLIAERYAPGYGPHTPVWGHSLSKSLTNALIGILVHEGGLRVQQTAPVAAWQAHGDPRNAITVDHLLRMSSGLPFDETGGPLNPMTRLFFLESDMAAYAEQVPIAGSPGTQWRYSNLGYLILSRIVRDAAGRSAVDSARFVREKLFEPLGMSTAIIECDASGTPIGASHVYASPRDWARFGQLYLDDGLAGERRILPQGWASYSTSQTLDTGYGAGFWINLLNEGSTGLSGTVHRDRALEAPGGGTLRRHAPRQHRHRRRDRRHHRGAGRAGGTIGDVNSQPGVLAVWFPSGASGCQDARLPRPGAAAAGGARLRRPRGSRGRLAVSPEWLPLHRSGAGTPMAPAPRVTSGESGEPADRRGGRGRRVVRRSGNLEIWKPGNQRGCGARQVFSFSGFQVFTPPRPHPAGGVVRGAASCSGPTEKLET